MANPSYSPATPSGVILNLPRNIWTSSKPCAGFEWPPAQLGVEAMSATLWHVRCSCGRISDPGIFHWIIWIWVNFLKLPSWIFHVFSWYVLSLRMAFPGPGGIAGPGSHQWWRLSTVIGTAPVRSSRWPPSPEMVGRKWYMGVSENSVPLDPMVNDHYSY